MSVDFIETVTNLNQELYDKFNETDLNFSYTTNGFVDAIMFGDILVWNSDIDDREFIEALNEYESFEPYIKNKLNKIIDHMYSIKL